MPLSKVVLKPGINKDDTPLASEGGYVDSDRVRFWRGMPQALGGWQLRQTATGAARGAHEWVDLQNKPLMAWGTADKLYAVRGGALIDITPPLSEGVLTNPFSTTNGSTIVIVDHDDHGLRSGNSITYTNATPVGGLTLNGTYPVTVLDEDSYSVTASTPATSTATSGAGVTVDYRAALPSGMVTAVASGYGLGPYGAGPYGGSSASDAEPRIWSLDNFGENLLANPRGGGLYEWQPVLNAPEMVGNGTFSTDTAWTKGAGWTISGGTANASNGTASLLSGPVPEAFAAGKVYRVTFNASVTAGTVKFQVNTASGLVDVGDASKPITRSGSYSRYFRAPVTPLSFVFSKDAAFAGTVDDVSVKLETAAYRVPGSPANIGWMFVDPNRFVVALATQEFDGDYNALLARWSDQENNTQWTPDTTNLSGELPLASGSRILSGLASRQQNLIWTDTSLFALTFTGDETVFTQRLLGTGCGIIGPNAAVEANGAAFWWSPNGFFGFQGSVPQRLDCSLERDVFDNLVTLQAHKVYAGLNQRYSEVWWMYPDARDATNECSRVVVFNIREQTWATHTMDRTCWLAGEIFGNPIGFSSDGMIYDHEVSQDANGMPLNSYLETAFFDVEDGNNLMNIMRIVPDFEAQIGPVSWMISGRPFPHGPEWTSGPYTADPTKQKLDMRRTARQLKLRIDTNTTPSFWRWGVPKIDAQKSGALR